MKSSKYKLFEELLHKADIKLNGDRPWDIKINDEAVFTKILESGSLGFGEGYMDHLWDCNQLDEMINRVLKADLDKKITGKEKLLLGKEKLKTLINPQSILRTKKRRPFSL